MTDHKELPELPKPAATYPSMIDSDIELYDESQMRAYARAALAASQPTAQGGAWDYELMGLPNEEVAEMWRASGHSGVVPFSFANRIQERMQATQAEKARGVPEGFSVVSRPDIQAFRKSVDTIREADEAYAAPQAPNVEPVSEMVNRFLGWKLPQRFSPDNGIVFHKPDDAQFWPIGTNLFTADEAKAMFEHCLAATPRDEMKTAIVYHCEECCTVGGGHKAKCSRAPAVAECDVRDAALVEAYTACLNIAEDNETPVDREIEAAMKAIRALRADQAKPVDDTFKEAYMEWSRKTDWVQQEVSSGTIGAWALGMHRADVLTRLVAELREPAKPSDAEDSVLKRLAFRTLWLAFRWNDHNFKAAHIEARETCARVGIITDDQADEWLETGKLAVKAKPSVDDERTKACVAACANIPTYQLYDEGGVPFDIAAMLNHLREKANKPSKKEVE